MLSRHAEPGPVSAACSIHDCTGLLTTFSLPACPPACRALGAAAVLALAARRLYRSFGGGSGGTPYGSQAYDPKTGLGRGAPGFQTNIQRIAVPPEIIARIRAGEEVSAEEITRAQEKMAREQEAAAARASGQDDAAAGKRKKRGAKR